MKTIIHDLFIQENFESTEFSNLIFYKKKSEQDIVYYWLIVEVDTLKNVLELQDEWFETSKKKMVLDDFDKNTSLLILTERKENENWKKEVLAIEEDPFEFKKYVLGYDQKSLKELKENSQDGDPGRLIKLMTSETVFNDYKVNYSDFTWQKLLYTISQKISFIKLNVETEKGLENLFADSNESLKKEKLYDTFKTIDEEFDKEKMDQLESLEFEQFYSSIIKEG